MNLVSLGRLLHRSSVLLLDGTPPPHDTYKNIPQASLYVLPVNRWHKIKQILQLL